jgi:hypothetical protein
LSLVVAPVVCQVSSWMMCHLSSKTLCLSYST